MSGIQIINVPVTVFVERAVLVAFSNISIVAFTNVITGATFPLNLPTNPPFPPLSNASFQIPFQTQGEVFPPAPTSGRFAFYASAINRNTNETVTTNPIVYRFDTVPDVVFLRLIINNLGMLDLQRLPGDEETTNRCIISNIQNIPIIKTKSSCQETKKRCK